MGSRDDRCCGTCFYHQREDLSGEFVCNCPDSDYYTDWTEYDDICDQYDER